MDEPTKQETELPDSEFSGMPCANCGRETRHKVFAKTKTHWEYANGMIDVWTEHQIVQCQGCLKVSFCETSACSEDVDIDESGEQYLPTTRKFFPSRTTGRPTMSDMYLLPPDVCQVYEEAHGALCSELPIMAGFGVRAIVEAVCKDKEVPGANLKERIDALAKFGFITSSGGEILHHLRFMGNAAAHDMKAHAPPEMNAAFDVLEYLLHGVYVLPKLAEMLPKHKKEP